MLIAANFIFVPKFGYMACAWAGVAGYGTATILSWIVGQKYYPIAYPVKDIMLYLALAAVLFAGISLANDHLPMWGSLAVNTLLVLVFCAVLVRRDFPLKNLPVVGKYFK